MVTETTRVRPAFCRWFRFNLVGLIGVAVQLGVLTLLRTCGVHYLAATALAVETAVLHNFAWHERWTWPGLASGREGTLGRLVRFNLTIGVVSITQTLFFVKILVGYFAIHDLAANMASIAMCSLINFFLSDRFVFSEGESSCRNFAFTGKAAARTCSRSSRSVAWLHYMPTPSPAKPSQRGTNTCVLPRAESNEN